MTPWKIGNTDIGDLQGTGTDFSIQAEDTDGVSGQGETEWINDRWTQQQAYYKQIPELKAAINAKSTWTVGKGFVADAQTTFLLDLLIGWGNDTFNTILENLIRTYYIGGDAFAEIIRDAEGNLINLKPLNPGTMKTIVNDKGIIIRYEQMSRHKKGTPRPFKPEKILHLSLNRVADEIHGTSMIDSVEEIILMRNEAMTDFRKVMHRNVYPVRIFYLQTDDPIEIAAFKANADKASDQGENLYVPMGAVEIDLASIAPNSTLNPLPWIQFLNQAFFQACGVPQIIVGGSNEITEATAKILYLAFQQTIEEEQLYLEEQVGKQLGITIQLEFPASLENELISDKSKSETMQASTPEDTNVQGIGIGGTA